MQPPPGGHRDVGRLDDCLGVLLRGRIRLREGRGGTVARKPHAESHSYIDRDYRCRQLQGPLLRIDGYRVPGLTKIFYIQLHGLPNVG